MYLPWWFDFQYCLVLDVAEWVLNKYALASEEEKASNNDLDGNNDLKHLLRYQYQSMHVQH